MPIALNELSTGVAALATILLSVRINRGVPVLAQYQGSSASDSARCPWGWRR